RCAVGEPGPFRIAGSPHMQWHRFLLVILVGGSLALPASAWPWSKPPQPAPSQYSSPDQASSVTPTISAAETAAQRVKELIGTLKTDPNDSKRLSALQELRQYDPRTYRELVPALVEALQRDPRPELRTELIQ